ncbi:hypothetical protein PsYK624_060620 [Phanerochaete sordida]|uniref:Uncharacterized protein n=1 Tax=Phanerochaete sordida TaxID=48140 RepID=A0A9P3G7X5_9APHY|nr:hypothetical protein PsYK624_060620 [Phanerochaete sordida]
MSPNRGDRDARSRALSLIFDAVTVVSAAAYHDPRTHAWHRLLHGRLHAPCMLLPPFKVAAYLLDCVYDRG